MNTIQYLGYQYRLATAPGSAWRLEVTYPMAKYPAYEKTIEKELGQRSKESSSGFGHRQLDFVFKSEVTAMAAKSKLDKLKLQGCESEVSEEEADE